MKFEVNITSETVSVDYEEDLITVSRSEDWAESVERFKLELIKTISESDAVDDIIEQLDKKYNSLEFNGVKIGITDDSVFATISNVIKIETEYDKDNWQETITRFETKVNKKIKKIGVVNNIIKELNIIHVGLLGKDASSVGSENKIISVAEAIKLSKGTVNVKGIITGKSEPFMIIVSGTGRCYNCESEVPTSYDPPLFSPTKFTRKCPNCKESTMEMNYDYEAAVRIRLRDEDVFEDFEANVILYDNDALDIGYGETVVISGDVHIIQVRGKNGKLIPYIFSNTVSSEYKKEIILTEADVEGFKRFANLPDLIDRLVSLFALGIVGGKSKKLALLRSMVNAQADKHKRVGSPSSIITTALIGDVGVMTKGTFL